MKSTLTDKIFDYIKDKIISGQWPANKKIPGEVELSEELGVSRLSLRTAIQKSNILGLTETMVGDGTYARDFTMRTYFRALYDSEILSRDFNEINDFRMILQIGSLRLAFEKPNILEGVKEIQSIYAEMEKAAFQKDLERFKEADVRFHQSVCALCDNELMFMLYDAIEHTLNEVTAQNVENSIKKSGTYDNVLHFHKAILDGIKERNIQKCIEAEMESRERSYSYYKKKSKS
ncbi:MAG: FCD domain-containing protein [Treponemataceae bacterium]